MAKISDKQIAIDKAKEFLISVEAEFPSISLPSGTHDCIYHMIRTIAEINEEELLATPTYAQLYELVVQYTQNNRVDMSQAVNKVAAAKETYAQDYLVTYLQKKVANDKPVKLEPALKYWE
jgi:hypothetical protein